MVGVNSCIHWYGTVAIFATLFAAIQVQGCTLDFEHASDFDLSCNGVKNSWGEKEKLKGNSNKKFIALGQGKVGCLKTTTPVNLSANTSVTLKFFQDVEKDVAGKIVLRLLSAEKGNCPEDECVWNVSGDPQFKPKQWITAQHKFPLKSTKDYHVQLQVNSTEGEFLLDRLTVKYTDPDKCQEVWNNDLDDETKFNLADPLVGTSGNDSSSLMEFSKVLVVTSASVVTLNNLFN